MCKVMGCADTAGAAFIVMHVTPRAGLEQMTKNGIRIFPNPNNGTFTISGDLDIANKDVSVKVTDIMGRVVYADRFNCTNGKVNAGIQLPTAINAGMYIVNISSDSQNIVSHIIVK